MRCARFEHGRAADAKEDVSDMGRDRPQYGVVRTMTGRLSSVRRRIVPAIALLLALFLAGCSASPSFDKRMDVMTDNDYSYHLAKYANEIAATTTYLASVDTGYISDTYNMSASEFYAQTQIAARKVKNQLDRFELIEPPAAFRQTYVRVVDDTISLEGSLNGMLYALKNSDIPLARRYAARAMKESAAIGQDGR